MEQKPSAKLKMVYGFVRLVLTPAYLPLQSTARHCLLIFDENGGRREKKPKQATRGMHGVSMGVYRLTKIDLIVVGPDGCTFAYHSYHSSGKNDFEILSVTWRLIFEIVSR